VDTLGYLLALQVTPASAQDREQVAALARRVQEVTGEAVAIGFVDQGYEGETAAAAAEAEGIELVVVKLPETRRGFVLLQKRWIAERAFAGKTGWRRLARDYERLATTLAALHLAAFAFIVLAKAAPLPRLAFDGL